MEKIAAGLQLMRPVNFLITFFTISVAAYLAAEGISFSPLLVLLAAFSGGLTAAGGNVINDIYDAPIDARNKPTRPIPSKRISENNAYIIYFIIVAASLIISLYINQAAFLVVLLANILLWFYSYHLKKMILIGNVIVAFLTAFTFFYGGIAVGNVQGAIIPAGFAFLINLIREIVKDMEDIEGDRIFGRQTLPIVFGFYNSKIIILILVLILFILTFLPFLFGIYSIEYFILVMMTVNLSLIYLLKLIFNNDSVSTLKRLSGILKLSMIFGLIAIFFGNESI